MSVVATSLRWPSSKGGSFTKTASGPRGPGAYDSRSRRRPVVPELWSTVSTPATSAPGKVAGSASVIHSASTASGVSGKRAMPVTTRQSRRHSRSLASRFAQSAGVLVGEQQRGERVEGRHELVELIGFEALVGLRRQIVGEPLDSLLDGATLFAQPAV